MKQRMPGSDLKLLGKRILRLETVKKMYLAAMLMTAFAYFIRNAVDRNQRGLVFLLGHIGARALHTCQHLLGSQLLDRAVDCHSRDAKLPGQSLFSGNYVPFLPFALFDPRNQ